MRLPWSARPGMVRVRERDWIQVLERAVRGGELLERSRLLEAHTAAVRAETRARELLAEREQALGSEFTAAARAGLLADLPTTPAGDLHEPAFVAWVDAELWAGWSELWTTAPDQHDDTRRSL